MKLVAPTKEFEKSWQEALVSCDADNTASRKVIEKNNGKLQERIIKEGKPMLKFCIELNQDL